MASKLGFGCGVGVTGRYGGQIGQSDACNGSDANGGKCRESVGVLKP